MSLTNREFVLQREGFDKSYAIAQTGMDNWADWETNDSANVVASVCHYQIPLRLIPWYVSCQRPFVLSHHTAFWKVLSFYSSPLGDVHA